MKPFKFEFQEIDGEVINKLIINNKIVVCLDCLGLRFGRHNIPDDPLDLTVLGAAIELKCIVREVEYYDCKNIGGNYNFTHCTFANNTCIVSASEFAKVDTFPR